MPPIYLTNLNGEHVFEQPDNVLCSGGEIPADEQLNINVACVKLLHGFGRKPFVNIENYIKKRCFIRMKNYNDTCLPRAITVNPKTVECIKYYNKVRNCINRCLRI